MTAMAEREVVSGAHRYAAAVEGTGALLIRDARATAVEGS